MSTRMYSDQNPGRVALLSQRRVAIFNIVSRILQDSTHHDLCYTSCAALAEQEIALNRSTMSDRSNDPWRCEWMLFHCTTSHYELKYGGVIEGNTEKRI